MWKTHSWNEWRKSHLHCLEPVPQSLDLPSELILPLIPILCFHPDKKDIMFWYCLYTKVLGMNILVRECSILEIKPLLCFLLKKTSAPAQLHVLFRAVVLRRPTLLRVNGYVCLCLAHNDWLFGLDMWIKVPNEKRWYLNILLWKTQRNITTIH